MYVHSKIARGLAVGAVLGATVLAVALAPWMASVTPLRHWIVTRIIADPDIEATAGRVSFGWFSPLQLHDLQLRRRDGQLHIQVDDLQAELSWLQLLLGQPELGSFHVNRPWIQLTLPVKSTGTDEPPRAASRSPALFSAVVRDGRFTLYTDCQQPPVLDIEHLQFTAHVQGAPDDRELVIEPARILDQQVLSPELCDEGLQLVAPILAHAARAHGQLSLELKRFRVPLDQNDEQRRSERMEIAGVVELHHVTARLQNPLLQQITQSLASVLRRDMPETIRVVDGTSVEFRVDGGRVHHEGLAFLLPEVSPHMVLQTAGSVGLDQTLDLNVQMPVPLTLVRDGPVMRRIADQPLRLHVAGTAQEPQVALAPGHNWWTELAGLMLEPGASGQTPPLAESLLDSMRDRRPLRRGLLGRR